MSLKKNGKKLLYIPTIALCILGGHSTGTGAAETALFTHLPQELIAQNLKMHDDSLAISVMEVIHEKRKNRDATIVDIRSKKDFERLHIPGSLNIPLYAVKTKTYLKHTPLVLVNEGINYIPLVSEAQRLAGLDFDVYILDGGLPAWHRRGGALTGDLLVLEEMKTISPKIFFHEKDDENTIVIDISPTRSDTSMRLVPCAKHLPLLDNNTDAMAAIVDLVSIKENKPFHSLIVFDESGVHYETAKRILNRLSIEAFSLQGGLLAYQKYLGDLLLSWKSRDGRMKTVGNCRPCSDPVRMSNP
jgi:rhodanese-related sulfurtransferase